MEGQTVVSISGQGSPDGVINLVRFDPTTYEVPIARGENGGRRLAHRNVVKEILKLGSWKGGEQQYLVPVGNATGRLETAILVQAGDAGGVLGAARL